MRNIYAHGNVEVHFLGTLSQILRITRSKIAFYAYKTSMLKFQCADNLSQTNYYFIRHTGCYKLK